VDPARWALYDSLAAPGPILCSDNLVSPRCDQARCGSSSIAASCTGRAAIAAPLRVRQSKAAGTAPESSLNRAGESRCYQQQFQKPVSTAPLQGVRPAPATTNDKGETGLEPSSFSGIETLGLPSGQRQCQPAPVHPTAKLALLPLAPHHHLRRSDGRDELSCREGVPGLVRPP